MWRADRYVPPTVVRVARGVLRACRAPASAAMQSLLSQRNRDGMSVRRVTLAAAGTAAIPLAGIAIARLLLPIKIPDMTRDVAAIAGIHPLSGILSSLGILFWWSSATLWLFAASLRRTCQGAAGVGFLVCPGLLSAYLGLDDLFQVHEYLVPTYLKVPEGAVYGVLALATACYLWRYRRRLLAPDGALLLLALALLSGSVVVDAVLGPWLWRLKDWNYFVEDGLKWAGICFWTAFSVVRCARELSPLLPMASDRRLSSGAGDSAARALSARGGS